MRRSELTEGSKSWCRASPSHGTGDANSWLRAAAGPSTASSMKVTSFDKLA